MNPLAAYGYLQRGQRDQGLQYDFMSYLFAYGGKVERDPANGDYTVEVNSPQVKAAHGSIGQVDII